MRRVSACVGNLKGWNALAFWLEHRRGGPAGQIQGTYRCMRSMARDCGTRQKPPNLGCKLLGPWRQLRFGCARCRLLPVLDSAHIMGLLCRKDHDPVSGPCQCASNGILARAVPSGNLKDSDHDPVSEQDRASVRRGMESCVLGSAAPPTVASRCTDHLVCCRSVTPSVHRRRLGYARRWRARGQG